MRWVWISGVLIGLATVAGCGGGKNPLPPNPTRIVDLSPPLTEDTIGHQYGKKASEFFGLKGHTAFTPVQPADTSHTFGFTYFELMSHEGAHLDAAARLLRDGHRPVEVPLEKLYGPARVLDLRWHDRASPISITDLQNYSLGKDEIILLDVGYEPPDNGDWPQYASLTPQAARWLADMGIRAIGTDAPSIGSLQDNADAMTKGSSPAETWATEVQFFQKDIPVIEGLVNLQLLLGEKHVVFAGFPLPLSERSGSPLRAVGLVFE